MEEPLEWISEVNDYVIDHESLINVLNSGVFIV